MTLAHRVSTSHSLLDQSRQLTRKHPYLAGLVAAVVAAAVSALINRHLAKKAEKNNPPLGQFLDINGVRCITWSADQANPWYSFTATAA